MAPPKRLLAFPFATLAYAMGWWGIAHATGVLGSVLPFLFVASYFGIFWLGWLAIPLLGVGATLGQPLLPERAQRPVRRLFIGWLLAWFGVLVGLIWLGPPPGFEAVPL